MSENKSIGERLGEAADSVKSKVNELGDRASANVRDAQAETADNPVEGAVRKGQAAYDRAKAEVHEERSERQADEASR
ncbi:hypothetical protein [Deinococcus yavapaiensis]|uniref:Uncharacterized protein n=1 Tax=Deinococcus yavapaiensis KR-236 TaxID=694435 RepID=A0A318SAJ2_9DEIO|nr:hypothetical protein [Deinococcus yavapaiensis]PYE53548.1 hypothetical protein DES52_10877 [Deinococcus yavapaiensis KR-236]